MAGMAACSVLPSSCLRWLAAMHVVAAGDLSNCAPFGDREEVSGGDRAGEGYDEKIVE